jgi:Fe-S-cluster containining protein
VSVRTNCCTGECCRRFILNDFAMADLQVRAWKCSPGNELVQIAAMVVSIGHGAWDGPGDWFTCRNWDQETMLCRIYDSRPPYLCGAYPYTSTCLWCGMAPTSKFLGDPSVVWPSPAECVDDVLKLIEEVLA